MGKQYLKLEKGMMGGERMQLLTKEMGIEGVGIVMSMIFMIRQQKGLKMDELKLPHMARRWGVDMEKMDRAIYGFGLFKREMEEGRMYISSVDLNIAMGKLTNGAKHPQLVANVRKRGDDGRFVVVNHDSYKEEEEEEKENENENEIKGTVCPCDNVPMIGEKEERMAWEDFIDRAMEDMIWLEMVAMNNHLPIRERLEDMVMIFKRHVRVQGSEVFIDSVQEAKRYFANYARMGKPTYKDLMRQLANSTPRETDPDSPYAERAKYRWEEVDRVTGERSYYGVRIPKEAPPRPSEYAVWHEGKWEG